MIEGFGSIEYTENIMKKISTEAKQELDIFSETKYKNALYQIVDYNLIRTK